MSKINEIDLKLFNEVIETVKKTNESLKSSYDLVKKKLEETQALLDSVLDNSNSAIIAADFKKGLFLKNRKAKELFKELGEEKVAQILAGCSSIGVHDYYDGIGRYFRLSVGLLDAENRRGYVYVLDDITLLKKLEEEKQRDERLKIMGEMAANIAHEVRNPLGSIELYASLLSRDLEEDPAKKRIAVSIIKGVRTINSVISNTLLFAKELKINPSEHNLADIVDDVVLYLQHMIKDKKIKIENRLDEENVVFCDEDMYKQVVMNLMSNAIEACLAGGKINVESFLNDNEIGLSISDNGAGISEDMLPRLFMPFQTTKAKGTGLGLSISYKIIKAHEGNIVAESNGRDYTKFTVTLPRVKGSLTGTYNG